MKRYRFKDRRTAEDEVTRCEIALTLHRIALDALLREEFAWTGEHTAPSASGFLSRFRMGVARANGPSGGVVMLREQYGTNKPTQSAFWAESWIASVREHHARHAGTDKEERAYRACFFELCDLAAKQAAA
jgi:hypothetical protein